MPFRVGLRTLPGPPLTRAPFEVKIPPALKFTVKTSAIRFLPLLLAAVALAPLRPVASRAAEDPEPVLVGGSWADFVEPDFFFYSSTLDARHLGPGWPTNNVTPRGIILNLGNDCWACFDTDLLRISAIWSGPGISATSMSRISYHSPGTKAIEGEDHLPQLLGEPWLANGIYPGWQHGPAWALTDPRSPAPSPEEVGRGPVGPADARFTTIRMIESGIRLEYLVDGASVREIVESRLDQGKPVVQRSFRLERAPTTLWLVLGRRPPGADPKLGVDFSSGTFAEKPLASLSQEPDGLLVVRVEPADHPVEFRVAFALGSAAKTSPAPASLAADTSSALRWPQVLSTRATLSTSREPYVVDNITLPNDNPWKRNVRLADIAFFQDGRAAAVTFDGDVWIIEGLGGQLDNVRWRRFASGLHEPLGLVIREERIYVFDRNGIWRLRDTKGRGEADVQELFSNAFAQTAETREFANGIKLAPDGSFVIAKGGIAMNTLGKHNGSVLRVSADGKSSTVLGWGFREPFIGVNPVTGLVTASDQQGHYVPSTPLDIVRDNQFYGFLSVIVPREQYPAPIADPLTWIPYPVNASGAGQVWLMKANMGPLNDSLIHLGYFRPEVFTVLLNNRASRPQASVLSVTRDLEFAPLNGAVNPKDGFLYLTGFQIFGSNARQVSGLARLRYTGAPSTLPRELVPTDRGILLRFDLPLDPKLALDSANYSAERWAYRRTFNYGSPHFKLDGSKGQDQVPPSSVLLSQDGRSVFVAIPDMKPVMQMRLGWAIATRDGVKFEQNAYFTPYELVKFDPVAEGFGSVAVDLTPRPRAVPVEVPPSIDEGRRLAELLGCAACHSHDGTTIGKVGPTWKSLFGRQETLSTGAKVTVDDAYIRESILLPAAKIVRGYDKSDVAMPPYAGLVSDNQIQSLTLFIQSLR